MKKLFVPAVLMFSVFTLITGILYPLLVTGIGRLMFPDQAEGSLLYDGEGRAIGSVLIGQAFDDPRYFWGRPSATSPAFNASSSSGSNYGPMNADSLKAVGERIKKLKEADPSNSALVPVDLVTASGSGLDPHISLAAAYYQISRIAKNRRFEPEIVRKMVDFKTEGRQLGFLGEPRVNVLELNLLLDRWEKRPGFSLEKTQDLFPMNMKWGSWENPRKL
jgi:K+-transporting ATPase ATPase C chain